ncbi:hypothetical protein IIB34_08000 [PVC group bacterium]|nr:hypothetical protein [PVC group bacterium]
MDIIVLCLDTASSPMERKAQKTLILFDIGRLDEYNLALYEESFVWAISSVG